MTTGPVPTWAAAWLAGAQADVLGVVDGRPHVVGGTMADGRRVVVKRDPLGRGAQAVRAMRAVGRVLNGGAVLHVPAVIAWRPRVQVVVQEAAPGVLLRHGLDTDQRPRLLRRAARALAALHASGARVGRATAMRDHLADLVHPHPMALARAVPEVASRVRALTAALTEWRPPPGTTAGPIHRDAHARQMLVDGDRLTLVDWDLAAAGDPALDVANFAVYLRTHLSAGADEAATAFLAAYAHAGADVTPRLPAYTALTCLRLAVKAWRLGQPGWPRRLRRRLTDAERALS